jgi:pilus assembly protein Flp/PilA
MSKLLMNFVRDESGQDLAEYGLLLALIAVALVTAIGVFKNAIVNAFNRATSAMSTNS